MAMILQCVGSDGRPLPYFFRGPPGKLNTSACLTLDYSYPCSYHCIGLCMPWKAGHATAVAPMILVDKARLLAEDQAEFGVQPYADLKPDERAQWWRYYARLAAVGMDHDPDDPQNGKTRAKLRKLRGLAIGRHDWWASKRPLAPAPPPPPNAGMPSA
ncbi:hypothetical protein HO173_010284 [Letharia columbiana]|uniref:Uncharacterized protein n=1 Tax=Letharia columbiana TaxID=112416 RepID=A0A8H6FN14_9LECA|nr:uncharacterized protein HO173_010284 [Letharia columbiana]KAF6231532.1 hypothetical protein HO173_010284 [Letharia columbiana]